MEEIKVKAGPSQTRLNSKTVQSLRSASLYKAILQEIGLAGSGMVLKISDLVEKPADLPFDASEDAKGAYWRGRCFLVQRNITSAGDARSVFGHEVIGHFGLRGFFGERLSRLLDDILFHNKNVQEAARKWIKNNADIEVHRNKNPGW